MNTERDWTESTGRAHSHDHDDPPLIVEDILLLLFQPSSGTIAGETTLFYILGGAVLADLAMRGLIVGTEDGAGRVAPHGSTPPQEELLRPAWEYVAKAPRHPQSVIAAVGPPLRERVISTLTSKGHLVNRRKKLLGLLPHVRIEQGSPRRDELLSRVRSVLVEEAPADEPTAALTALLSASTQLHQLAPDIPWTSAVIERARVLQARSPVATNAGEGVLYSTLALINGAVAAATSAGARGMG